MRTFVIFPFLCAVTASTIGSNVCYRTNPSPWMGINTFCAGILIHRRRRTAALLHIVLTKWHRLRATMCTDRPIYHAISSVVAIHIIIARSICHPESAAIRFAWTNIPPISKRFTTYSESHTELSKVCNIYYSHHHERYLSGNQYALLPQGCAYWRHCWATAYHILRIIIAYCILSYCPRCGINICCKHVDTSFRVIYLESGGWT